MNQAILSRFTRSVASLTATAAFALLLIYSETSVSAARESFCYAAQIVIPSLFPSLVLSSFLLAVRFPPFLLSLIPCRALGFSACSAPVLLCGFLSSFPVGAMLSTELYERGQIDRNECARLSAVSSLVSPAFLINVVGSLTSSRLFGLILYLSEIVVSLLFARLTRRVPDHSVCCSPNVSVSNVSLADALCSSVAKASLTSLSVVGFLVFFRVLAAVLSCIFPSLTLMFSLTFEFSSGVKTALSFGSFSPAVIGFTVGFGGLCGIAQCVNFLARHNIRVWPLLFFRLFAGLFLGTVGFLMSRYLPLPFKPVPVFALSSPIIPDFSLLLLPLCVFQALSAKYFSHDS